MERERFAISDLKTIEHDATIRNLHAELAQARQQIEELNVKLSEEQDAVDRQMKKRESAEQQLAAAQAALLQGRTDVHNLLAELEAHQEITGHKLEADDAEVVCDIQERWKSEVGAEQPTDALRAFVLGLLPTKCSSRFSRHIEAFDFTLDEIRANMERKLNG